VLLKVRSKVDACRPLETNSRAHGGSVKCLKVRKKPKGEGLVSHQCCGVNSMPAKNAAAGPYVASGPGADTSIM